MSLPVRAVADIDIDGDDRRSRPWSNVKVQAVAGAMVSSAVEGGLRPRVRTFFEVTHALCLLRKSLLTSSTVPVSALCTDDSPFEGAGVLDLKGGLVR